MEGKPWYTQEIQQTRYDFLTQLLSVHRILTEERILVSLTLPCLLVRTVLYLLRIHFLGEKPHECKECGKAFAASSNLYYHRMTHTNVRYDLIHRSAISNLWKVPKFVEGALIAE